MNSVMKLIFKEKIAEKSEDCGSREQYGTHWCALFIEKKSTTMAKKKKEKKKEENTEKWKRIRTNVNPNTHKLKVIAKVY